VYESVCDVIISVAAGKKISPKNYQNWPLRNYNIIIQRNAFSVKIIIGAPRRIFKYYNIM